MLALLGTRLLSPAIAAFISLSISSYSEPLNILEVVKVYGKLAGPSCYGKVAPAGSSCQVTLTELKQELGLVSSSASSAISRDQLGNRLDKLKFQWPLKPYGVDKSLEKTAVVNKGAETALYMNLLEEKGLYDRRNPTGPLPTSLRPKLNQILEREKLHPQTVDRVFDVLAGVNDNNQAMITEEKLDGLFLDRDALDYYDFVKLLGADNISWK